MLLAAVVPAVIYYVLTSRIPESPHYLVARGRTDEARRTVVDVQGTEADAEIRLTEIEHALRNAHKPRVRDLFGGSFGLLPIVWAGIGLAVFQQFVGINVIFYYSSILWQSSSPTDTACATAVTEDCPEPTCSTYSRLSP
jgi:SP family sugar:H+ symporter-like MFS transporter